MAKIISKINPRSPEFIENAAHMQVQVDDLKVKQWTDFQSSVASWFASWLVGPLATSQSSTDMVECVHS